MPFLTRGPLEGGDATINSVLKETVEVLRQNLSVAAFGRVSHCVLCTDPGRKACSSLVQRGLGKQLCTHGK